MATPRINQAYPKVCVCICLSVCLHECVFVCTCLKKIILIYLILAFCMLSCVCELIVCNIFQNQVWSTQTQQALI